MTDKRRASLLKLLAVALFGFALTISGNVQDPFLYSHKVAQLVPNREATALGFTTAAGLVMAVLTQPIVGVFSDRTRSPLGRRAPFFIAGTLGAILCLYLIALAPAWWMVVAGILLIQVFSNVIQGPWQALIPDQIPHEQHGMASSIKGLLEVLAALVGGFAAGKIIAQADVWGENAAVLAAVTLPASVFVITLIVTLFGAREVDDIPPPAETETIAAALGRTFHVDFQSYPTFIWWFGNRMLFWAGLLIVRTFLILFAGDVLGMTQAQAQDTVSTVTLVLGGLLLLALLPSGYLSDRFGRRPLVMVAGALAALGTTVIVVFPNLTTVYIGGGLVGLGSGIFISTNWALVTDIVPADEAARYLGMANIATAGGSLLGRLLGGSLIDPVNAAAGTTTAGYLLVYGIAAAFFLISAVIIRGMPDVSGQQPHVETEA